MSSKRRRTGSSFFILLWWASQLLGIQHHLGIPAILGVSLSLTAVVMGGPWVYRLSDVAKSRICLALALFHCRYSSLSNHVTLAIITNFYLSLRPRDLQGLRIMVIALYLVAGFHKLNWDYFDSKISCCSQLTTYMAYYFLPFLGAPWITLLSQASIPLSLVLEFGLPIALTFREYRKFGLVVAVLFHMFLCLPPPPSSFYPFSLPMLVLLTTFYGTPSLASVASWIHDHHTILLFLGFSLVGTCQVLGQDFYEYPAYGWYRLSPAVFLPLLGAHLLLLNEPLDTFGRGGSLWPALTVLAISLLPYLGLRTYSAFAMFSNLRMSGGVSNHLLLGPAPWFVRTGAWLEVTNIPEMSGLQIDLAKEYYPKALLSFFQDILGASATLIICPPKWNKPLVEFTRFWIPQEKLRQVVHANQLEGYLNLSDKVYQLPADLDDLKKDFQIESPPNLWISWFQYYGTVGETNECRH